MTRLMVMVSAGTLAASSAVAQPNAAKGRVPILRVADSIVLQAKLHEALGIPGMALRSDGTIALAGDRLARLVLLDSTGRRKWVRDLQEDLYSIDGLAWRGDSLYLYDNVRDHVLSVGANGGVGAINPYPDLVRPKWSARRTMGMYGSLDVTSAATEGALIGVPHRPHLKGVYGPGTAPSGQVFIVRSDYDGIVQGILATVANDPKANQWLVLGDGRVIVLRFAPDSTTFIAISAAGDTLFTRRMAPLRFAPRVAGGPDGTIWLTTAYADNAFIHTAFDRTGSVVGQIDLPATYRIGAGDAKHVWVIDDRGARNRRIVRYRLRGVP